ncbi:MAG: nucleotidyltransferase domain-containing protein [Gemmatimonadetes bacterium]|nr:nucleotidyltransferase domain-containing protein [Gemmatimonadota bacterium]
MLNGSKTLNPAVLEEIVRRIVEVVQPERVILFGSAARGEMGFNSDVDLLVVKGGEYSKRDADLQIRRALSGTGQAFDIVLATPEEVERYRDSWMLVIYPALREGKVVYAA